VAPRGRRPRIAACLLQLALLVAAAAPAPAHAAARDDAAEAARARYALGRTHYRAGDFAAALAEFERGYALKPAPLFLYNIAQAARQAGQLARARETYRAYLAVAPRGPERALARQHLATLERVGLVEPRPAPPAVAAVATVAVEPAPRAVEPQRVALPPVEPAPSPPPALAPAALVAAPPPAPPPTGRGRLRPWAWALIGTSIAAVVVGGAVGLGVGLAPRAPTTDLGLVRTAP